MRTALSLKWMLALACVLSGVSGADAAERIIRPRRTNRITGGISAVQAAAHETFVVESPVAEDGGSQAPLTTLTPPDSVFLKSGLMRPANLMREFGEEYADNSTKDYQEKTKNPPETAGKTPEEEKEKTVAEQPEQPEKTKYTVKAGAETPEKDTGKLVKGLPPYVSYDNYQEMNRQRQDFHPPLETPESEESVPSPEPAPGTALPPKYKEPAEPAEEPQETAPVHVPENTEIPPAAPLLYADGTTEPQAAGAPTAEPTPPTPAEVESYRRRLEFRLLEQYNNLPEHAGNVGKVTIVLSKPLQPSLDGTRLRAEFDQLVYDPWGKRIPALEKEYYVVTFSAGGVRQVRSDPSIRVGLNHERTYSEPAPTRDIAEKVRTLPPDHAFRAAPRTDEAPRAKMPDWWRPEFADDRY